MEALGIVVDILHELKNQGQESLFLGELNWQFLKEISENVKVKPCPASKEDPGNTHEKCHNDESAGGCDLLGASNAAMQSTTIQKNISEDGPYKKTVATKKEHWEDIKSRVLHDESLKKHVRPGKRLVFGVGNLDAKIFFCGEAPGSEEEEQGIPFVGRAGQLLTKIIAAMGLSRDDVYIGNIMNWRPEMDSVTGNRPPTQEEMQFCLPYLMEQVDVVQPEVIVALGATAVSGLLGYDKNRKMSQIRGKWHEFCKIPLMITFHPSYLLRNNTNKMKRVVWEDMLCVMERVGMAISDRQKQYFL